MIEQEKRFSAGDTLTYKARPKKGYHHGGDCQAGRKGTLLYFVSYNKLHECWSIEVTVQTGGSYTMLEKDFEEYEDAEQLIRIQKKKIKLFEV
jgi:hypothetical protein